MEKISKKLDKWAYKYDWNKVFKIVNLVVLVGLVLGVILRISEVSGLINDPIAELYGNN